MSGLVEVDSLEALIIIDNELDVMSKIPPGTVSVTKTSLNQLATGSKYEAHDRGAARKELRMDSICCAAHGLSIMLVGGTWGISSQTNNAQIDCDQRKRSTFYPL